MGAKRVLHGLERSNKATACREKDKGLKRPGAQKRSPTRIFSAGALAIGSAALLGEQSPRDWQRSAGF